MNFFLGFIIGTAIGANVALFVTALISVNKKTK